MEKYVSNPNVLLHGTGFTSIFTASEFEDYRADYEHVLHEYGIDHIDPDGWYPRQVYLDVFKRIAAKPNASTNMVSAGVRIIHTIRLPSEVKITSLMDALQLLVDVYHLDQQNLPPDDIGYQVTQEGPKHLRVVDLSPYPHDLNYGYIYGLLKRFAPNGVRPVMERTFINPNAPDKDGAVYDITWD